MKQNRQEIWRKFLSLLFSGMLRGFVFHYARMLHYSKTHNWIENWQDKFSTWKHRTIFYLFILNFVNVKTYFCWHQQPVNFQKAICKIILLKLSLKILKRTEIRAADDDLVEIWREVREPVPSVREWGKVWDIFCNEAVLRTPDRRGHTGTHSAPSPSDSEKHLSSLLLLPNTKHCIVQFILHLADSY